MAIDQADAWPFPIQWARPFEERYAFRTEIIVAYRGGEQRIAQRVNPRIGYGFEVFLNATDFPTAVTKASPEVGRLYYFPHPRNVATLMTATAMGATTAALAGSSLPGWAGEGRNVFFGREMATIDSVAGQTLTLTSALANAYAAGTEVRWGVPARLDRELPILPSTSTLGHSRMTFTGDPVTNWHEFDAGTTTTPAANDPAWSDGPNWRNRPSVRYTNNWIDLDFERGAVDRIFPEPNDRRVLQATFTGLTEAATLEMIELFYKVRGRQRSFLAPSFLSVGAAARNRFESDTLVVRWLSTTIAETVVNMRTVPA